MSRANHAEVSAIERCDLNRLQALGGCHDRRIDRPESKVGVFGNEFRDPYPVLGVDRFRDQVPRRKIAEKPNFGLRPEARVQQVGDLSYDELGDDQGTRMVL